MLTKKQQELLIYISRRLGDGGVSPSFDEMKDALGLKSKSGIHRLITGLEERGFLRRLPHRARALEVLKMPQGVTEAPPPARPFRPEVIDGAGKARAPMRGRKVEAAGEVLHLPLYGRIAAGTPIEALRDSSAFAEVPASMLASGDHYALEVSGDSMVEAGILDGDTVIIRRAEGAENGDIVVALVDEQEVTLKRLRRKGDTVALEPANPSYETRIFGPDRVKVQGRLVGLIRHY